MHTRAPESPCVLLALAFCLRYNLLMSDQATLLLTGDADTVREELHDHFSVQILKLHGDLAEALGGSDAATRRYVSDYRALAAWLMDEVHRTRAEQTASALVAVCSTAVLRDVLEGGSAEAPFTPWTARYDLGDAVAVDLINRLRTLTGMEVLRAPTPPHTPAALEVGDVELQRFMRRVRFYLRSPEDREPLSRLMETFALSKVELGRLFDVTRQAIDGWIEHGVPAERQEKLAALLALADVLERKLKVDRIAGVARRPADAYGGISMLDMVAADRHQELLASVHASFDWSRAA